MTLTETIEKLDSIQMKLWTNISNAISNTFDTKLVFVPEGPKSTNREELMIVFPEETLVASFTFSERPENPLLIIIPNETFASFNKLANSEADGALDENSIPDARPAIESVLQGICQSAGAARSETVVASDLQIRFQIINFPQNMSEEFISFRAEINCADWTGEIQLLVDQESAMYLTNSLEKATSSETIMFPQVQDGGLAHTANNDPNSLDRLLDIPLEISVELGRMKMLVKDVVELGTGSIIEIEKSAGEPVDILVNGRLVARGEVVVIEDNFGVRVTEILSPQDRLNKLNEVA